VDIFRRSVGRLPSNAAFVRKIQGQPYLLPSELHLNQADPNIESITVNPVTSVAGEKRDATGASG